MVDPLLRRIDVKFNTSSGEEVSVEAVYQDTAPSGSRLGTVVAIHGAPGSHKDFKYVTPLLHEKGIRFIGVNMPGFGSTPGDPRLRCDNTERNNFVCELINRIGNIERLVVMGHSRGSENAVAVAARNTRLVREEQVYNSIIGLRLDTGERAMMCVRTMSHIELAEGLLPNIDRINRKQDARVLVAYSGKDFLIETSISRELADAFKDHIELRSEDDDELTESKATQQTRDMFSNGTKTVSINFEKCGHFLQRDRSQYIADAIEAILQNSKGLPAS
ncbi:unnamed protein product [Haemonchus placei]|uniref:AB hydrolase-1 domain-containing protein n=1 Tax=Haemonchus placei TaxID=6290 RepID=A0A0N4WQB6_HAEPC|nr:unnamed protein product [Haemonchus placei]